MLISMFEIHANQSAAKLFAVDQTLVCKIVFTIPETQDRYWKQKTKLQGKEVYFHSKHADNVCYPLLLKNTILSSAGLRIPI